MDPFADVRFRIQEQMKTLPDDGRDAFDFETWGKQFCPLLVSQRISDIVVELILGHRTNTMASLRSWRSMLMTLRLGRA